MATELGDPDDPDIRERAKGIYNDLIEDHLKKRESFGFETVYSSNTRVKVLERARELGYRIVAFFLSTGHQEINIERVKDRSRKGGHKVPTKEISRHWLAAPRNLVATWHLFDRIEFYDTTEPLPRLVATKDGGLYVLADPPSPKWLAPITRHGKKNSTNIRTRSSAKNRS